MEELLDFRDRLLYHIFDYEKTYKVASRFNVKKNAELISFLKQQEELNKDYPYLYSIGTGYPDSYICISDIRISPNFGGFLEIEHTTLKYRNSLAKSPIIETVTVVPDFFKEPESDDLDDDYEELTPEEIKRDNYLDAKEFRDGLLQFVVNMERKYDLVPRFSLKNCSERSEYFFNGLKRFIKIKNISYVFKRGDVITYLIPQNNNLLKVVHQIKYDVAATPISIMWRQYEALEKAYYSSQPKILSGDPVEDKKQINEILSTIQGFNTPSQKKLRE